MNRTYAKRPAHERFWPKVKKTDGCWEWQGAIGKGGYGNFWDGERYINAHRYAFEEVNGPLPAGMQACHSCDNRKCVRPDHLYAGTQSENLTEMHAKGRWTGIQRKGAEHNSALFTNEQVAAIRAEYQPRFGAISRLARKYKVNWSTMKRIVTNVTYSELAEVSAEEGWEAA